MVALQPRLVPTRTSTSRPSVDPSSRVTSNAREPAHLPLHRRLLYPYDPPEKSIPPLIPGDTPELIIINERCVLSASSLPVRPKGVGCTTSSPSLSAHTFSPGTPGSRAIGLSSRTSINPSSDLSSHPFLPAFTSIRTGYASFYCSTCRLSLRYMSRHTGLPGPPSLLDWSDGEKNG